MSSVLLVGRTNAGKSSLFNALIGKSVSIVDQTENLTNDIVKFVQDDFVIYDSPGFERMKEFELFLNRVRDYDTVCIVCDPMDYSQSLCRSILGYFKDKKCILIINKSDLLSEQDKSKFSFSNLETFFVSTLNKVNIDKLRQRLSVPKDVSKTRKEVAQEVIPSWSVFGRANVGKSTIANYLVGFDRFTVMNKVGTTREINPETIQKLGVTLIDTPGYRKSNSMDDVSKASQYRLENYIKKTEGGFAIFVIDASEGFLRTDRMIINKILEKFTLFFVINKVDLVEQLVLKDMEIEIKRMYPNMEYVFFSSVSGVGTDQFQKLMEKTQKAHKKTISTPSLNKWIQNQQVRPVKYITQKSHDTFLLFAKKEIPQTQIRRLENSLCETFDIKGRRIKFEIRIN